MNGLFEDEERRVRLQIGGVRVVVEQDDVVVVCARAEESRVRLVEVANGVLQLPGHVLDDFAREVHVVYGALLLWTAG